MKMLIDNNWLRRNIRNDPNLESDAGVPITEVERLAQRLTDMGAKNFKVFWGPEAHLVSAEKRALMLNASLDEIESGNATPVEEDWDDGEEVS